MTKHLLALFILLSFDLISQPVLQEANFMQIGFSCNMHFAGSITATPAGPNQTWNYASLTTTLAGITSAVNPSATPCNSLYPTSNYAWILPGPKYRYHNRSLTELEIMSNDIVAACSPNGPYSDYMKVLQFPFSYLQTFTDPFQQGPTPGTVVATYDAYGTLTTPFGTYPNVVRINMGAQSMYITTGNPSFIVMLAFNNSTTVFFSNPVIMSIQEQQALAGLSVYPNPSNGLFYIDHEGIEDGEDISVYNVLGEMIHVLRTTYNTSPIEIDLRGKAKGIYFAKFKASHHIVTRKLIVE